MGMMKEFKEFAMKGNVVDMAVGIIIGAAFGAIVTSAVGDLIMPVVGSVGKADFSNHYLPLSEAVKNAQATNAVVIPLADAKKIGPVFAYGNFLTAILNFVIVAFCIFMMIKAMNNLRKRMEQPAPAAPAAPTTKECPQCCMTINIKAQRCPHCTSQIA